MVFKFGLARLVWRKSAPILAHISYIIAENRQNKRYLRKFKARAPLCRLSVAPALIYSNFTKYKKFVLTNTAKHAILLPVKTI
jgi:hypothetical protein